jgi:hypothetical protein
MSSIPYKVYTKEDVEENVEYKRGKGYELITYYFKFGILEFAILYIPDYFVAGAHISFYAMSYGFESYTETGYKSVFTNNKNLSKEEIEEYMAIDLEDAGISLKNPTPIQATLF